MTKWRNVYISLQCSSVILYFIRSGPLQTRRAAVASRFASRRSQSMPGQYPPASQAPQTSPPATQPTRLPGTATPRMPYTANTRGSRFSSLASLALFPTGKSSLLGPIFIRHFVRRSDSRQDRPIPKGFPILLSLPSPAQLRHPRESLLSFFLVTTFIPL